ncbi:hypothetical protein EKK58_09490 [Candidatus Dependentiae bacterium]|nr:MAG: hypothetical protein EKK58_09490 [Candidatus Dependentiae bacterium]
MPQRSSTDIEIGKSILRLLNDFAVEKAKHLKNSKPKHTIENSCVPFHIKDTFSGFMMWVITLDKDDDGSAKA